MPASAAVSTRPHLSEVLAPRRIAIVGASRNPRSLAARYLDHLLKHEFPGDLVPINRGADEVRGIPAVPSLEEVEGPLGCALITVPERDAAAAAITRRPARGAAGGDVHLRLRRDRGGGARPPG